MLYYVIRCGKMKPLKESISLTLDTDILEQIKILAKDCDRSVSQYVNFVLKNHIKRAAKNTENKE